MSHSSSATPLSDVLPWGSPITVTSDASSRSRSCSTSSAKVDDRTLLVTDACSTDSRFLLHTLALQFLSSRHTFDSSDNDGSTTMEGAVLWISCAPVAEKQILMGLRKGLQHNLGGGNTTGPASSWMGGKGSASASGSSSIGQGGIGNSSGRIHIVSVPLELADGALGEQEEGESSDATTFSHETYLKRLHKRIVHWLERRELVQGNQSQEQQQTPEKVTLGPNLIIIDNVTTLGTLFGDRLANTFVSSVRSLMKKHSKKRCSQPSSKAASANGIPDTVITSTNLLAIRASSPDDGGLYQLDGDDSMKGEKLRSEYARLLRPWLGFGSGMSTLGSNKDGAGTDILQMEEQTNYLSLSPDSVPSLLYRSGLYEIADGIVDVSPLESGYARDVLGRLSFTTTWNGRGWWGNTGSKAGSGGSTMKKEDLAGAYTSICVNYRCDDSGVRVMRLRSR